MENRRKQNLDAVKTFPRLIWSTDTPQRGGFLATAYTIETAANGGEYWMRLDGTFVPERRRPLKIDSASETNENIVLKHDEGFCRSVFVFQADGTGFFPFIYVSFQNKYKIFENV